MASLEGLVASLQGPLVMEQLRKAQAAGGVATPPIAEQSGGTKPLSVEELLGKFIGTPIPIGTPFAQGYAPGGPQLNFTGGSPFPVDDTPGALHNGALVLKELTGILGELRKKKTAADAASKASKSAAGSK